MEKAFICLNFLQSFSRIVIPLLPGLGEMFLPPTSVQNLLSFLDNFPMKIVFEATLYNAKNLLDAAQI
jgi:hypothetical protein